MKETLLATLIGASYQKLTDAINFSIVKLRSSLPKRLPKTFVELPLPKMSSAALPAGHKVCLNHVAYNYTGKESTPQGLGYCAEAEDIGKVMMGRDKHMWTVGIKNSMKVWVRIPDQMVARKEIAPMAAKDKVDEKEDKADEKEKKPVADDKEIEVDNEDAEEKETEEEKAEEQEEQEEEEKPAPKAKKPRAPKAKKEKVVKEEKEEKENTTDDENKSETESTQEKKKRGPSAYNVFIKEKLAELRKNEPGLQQKEYMLKAAVLWNEYKEANGMPATKPKAPKAKAPKVEDTEDKEETNEKPAKKEKPVKKEKPAKKETVSDDSDDASSTTADKEKKKRAPTAYNIFMKEKMAELRANEPGLPNKEYMSKAAALYREQKNKD